MKKGFLFFLGYLLFMASIISIAVFGGGKQEAENKNSGQTVGEIFKEELKQSEELKMGQSQKETAAAKGWKPSNEFVRNAVIGASVLDVVIILIWARYVNRRNQGKISEKKRWTDQKWFWNVVALGIVQPKDSKIVVNWRNLILVVAAMYILKKFAFDHFLNDKSAEKYNSLLTLTIGL